MLVVKRHYNLYERAMQFFTEANKYRSGKPTHTPSIAHQAQSKAYLYLEQALPYPGARLTRHQAITYQACSNAYLYPKHSLASTNYWETSVALSFHQASGLYYKNKKRPIN